MRTRKPEFSDKKIIASLVNKDGSQNYSADISALLAFGENFAKKILTQLEAFSKTRALPPVIYAHQLAKWGACLTELKIEIQNYDLESASDLEELHLIFLEWFFTQNPSSHKNKLSTLKRDWTNIGGFINYCQDNKALPIWDWFQIPTHGQHELSQINTRTDSTKTLALPPKEVDHSKFFSKIISNGSLVVTTQEYLLALQLHLQSNLDLIAEICYKNIEEMIVGHEEGCFISDSADIALLKQLPLDPSSGEAMVVFEKKIKRGDQILSCRYSTSLFSLRHPNGLANSLWWIKNRLGGSLDRNEVTKNSSQLVYIIRKHGIEKLKKYLGSITHSDLINFITLIIIKCPEISNLSPVVSMRASNLQHKGNEFGVAIVDKRRAREYKSNLLEPRLKKAMLFLKERTECYRQSKKDDEFSSDALFIGIKGDTLIAIPRRLSSTSVVGKHFKLFLCKHKEISHLSHITFSMIRNSHAVIEYIKSGGDWYKVALSLGHQIGTAMRHYIPQQIKDLMRERKVRQFQNEMLFVSAFDKNINILEAVDFETQGELELFIKNFIRIESNKTDVLLKVLDKKITELSETTPANVGFEVEALDTAFISLSVPGLTALLGYVQHIEKANLPSETLYKKNSITGISPSFWTSLAAKLKIILTSKNYENIEHKSIFKTALDNLAELKSSLTFKIEY